ncbi:arginine vasopressin-induced protein 1 [Ascaphus truei]|uniref:arginine vasopressin-induced protein 1 n=1 Tax=Ascaphus truei TaxID=8439 RepID=UPI003F5A95EE
MIQCVQEMRLRAAGLGPELGSDREDAFHVGGNDGRDALISRLNQCGHSDCTMGTPASVISTPSTTWQAPEPRARKSASANIFKDVGLLQIETLFRTSGDECADERARIICEYAGDRRIAEALIQLRRKKRNKAIHQPAPKLASDQIGALSIQHFSKLCIHEVGHRGSTSHEDDTQQKSSVSQDRPSGGKQKRPALRRAAKTKQQQRRISDYMHKIRR